MQDFFESFANPSCDPGKTEQEDCSQLFLELLRGQESVKGETEKKEPCANEDVFSINSELSDTFMHARFETSLPIVDASRTESARFAQLLGYVNAERDRAATDETQSFYFSEKPSTRLLISTDVLTSVKVPEKPGSVQGADGSRIEFDTAPDGTIRPKSITHGDGTTTDYQWDKAGKLIEATTRSKKGDELVKVVTNERGVTITQSLPSQSFKDLKGELAVAEDGNWTFKGKNHEWSSKSGGGIVGDVQQNGGKFRWQLTDTTTSSSQEVNGKFQLFMTCVKDGTRVIYA